MTRKSIALPVSLGLLAALVAAAFFVFGNPARSEAAGGQQIAVALVGTAPALEAAAMPEGAPEGALCFTVNMIDLNTGNVIGDATDCLSDIDAQKANKGGGIKLTGTTFFNFSNGSQLVSQGLTTVQPLLHGQNGFTHSTAAPAPLLESNILMGTGKFSDAAGSGTVRLSGLVNMNDLNEEGGFRLTFDCIFVIDHNGAN